MSIQQSLAPIHPMIIKKTAQFPRADKLLSYVILACGICTVGIGATQILTSHSLVPFWDEWTEIDAIATAPHHQLPLSWLWSQHNEHRIVFYRLLLLADIHVFHGKHWISFWNDLLRNDEGVNYHSETASRKSITRWLLRSLESNRGICAPARPAATR